MKRKLIIGGSALILAVLPTMAQDNTNQNNVVANQNVTNVTYETAGEDLFRANEFDLDLFGTLALGEHSIDHLTGHKIYHNSRLGAGAGGTYFFCKYIGLEGEAYTEDTSPRFINDAGGNLVVRIPIPVIHLAPYGFAGGGYKWDPYPSSYADAGAGIEYRFMKNFGIFTDARWVWPDHIRDYFLGRAGLRFAF
jgi:hypothetical protein